MHMVAVFLEGNAEAVVTIQELHQQIESTSYTSTFKSSLSKIQKLRSEFDEFAKSMSDKDPNWRFWNEFVTLNGLSYIAFYIAVRSANWNLRLASLKLMAHVFRAMDRPTYGKLLPQHIEDCLHDIKAKLIAGGFTMSFTGRAWHSVGLDEAHEMLINKECKTAVVSPNKEFVRRMALYFPFRSRALNNSEPR